MTDDPRDKAARVRQSLDQSFSEIAAQPDMAAFAVGTVALAMLERGEAGDGDALWSRIRAISAGEVSDPEISAAAAKGALEFMSSALAGRGS